MEAILGHCSTILSEQHSLLLALLLGGLMGGFTHCLAMCGGFAACRAACNSGGCERSTTLNLEHHLGRALSYGLLGTLVASLGATIAVLSWWPKLQAALLALAGAMFLVSSLAPKLAHHASSHRNVFLRGFLLGFMPCGLIYAALMLVAASASPLVGFLGMVVFVLGTLPALMLAQLGVAALSLRWREEVARLGRVLLACNGVFLFMTASKLVM